MSLVDELILHKSEDDKHESYDIRKAWSILNGNIYCREKLIDDIRILAHYLRHKYEYQATGDLTDKYWQSFA